MPRISSGGLPEATRFAGGVLTREICGVFLPDLAARRRDTLRLAVCPELQERIRYGRFWTCGADQSGDGFPFHPISSALSFAKCYPE
jgi:hypothetical protein